MNPLRPGLLAAAAVLAAATTAHAGNLVIRIPVPDLGVGFAVGQTRVDDAVDGSTRAVSLRLRFGGHLELAGELGKATYGDDQRTDLRYGGGAYLHLRGRGRISPYGGIAAGSGTVERGGWYTAQQGYAHLALGLNVPLSRRIALAGEVDVGRRKLRMTSDPVLLADQPGYVDLIYIPDEETYRQVHLGLVLSF